MFNMWFYLFKCYSTIFANGQFSSKLEISSYGFTCLSVDKHGTWNYLDKEVSPQFCSVFIIDKKISVNSCWRKHLPSPASKTGDILMWRYFKAFVALRQKLQNWASRRMLLFGAIHLVRKQNFPKIQIF